MRIVLFCHSILSDWNHGNAHFLRGLASELIRRGHELDIWEPEDGWSRSNLIREHGAAALAGFHRAYPLLHSRLYRLENLDLDAALEHAGLVLVHEWSEPELVSRIGLHRALHGGYTLLFHDTHHRSVSAPHELERFGLAYYDGVLAFGETVRSVYLERGWAGRVWTFHEAADPYIARPLPQAVREADLVWIGNWGDDERAGQLREFLIEPVRTLGLRARVHGVRYPQAAIEELRGAGIEYAGWLPNYRVPEVFAKSRVTVHIPRRPYAEALKGIPTIRPFEALACGIPLVSAPWEDSEHLFHPGRDFLMASNGGEMVEHLRSVLGHPDRARALAAHGRATVLSRHTCSHRADQLLDIVNQVNTTEVRLRETA